MSSHNTAKETLRPGCKLELGVFLEEEEENKNKFFVRNLQKKQIVFKT